MFDFIWTCWIFENVDLCFLPNSVAFCPLCLVPFHWRLPYICGFWCAMGLSMFFTPSSFWSQARYLCLACLKSPVLSSCSDLPPTQPSSFSFPLFYFPTPESTLGLLKCLLLLSTVFGDTLHCSLYFFSDDFSNKSPYLSSLPRLPQGQVLVISVGFFVVCLFLFFLCIWNSCVFTHLILLAE